MTMRCCFPSHRSRRNPALASVLSPVRFALLGPMEKPRNGLRLPARLRRGLVLSLVLLTLIAVAGRQPAGAQSRQSTFTLHSFQGNGLDTLDTGNPTSDTGDVAHGINSLVAGPDGRLYGASWTFLQYRVSTGPNYVYDHYYVGTVFQVAPDHTTTVLHTFQPPAGSPGSFHPSFAPLGGVTLASDGWLYGIAFSGGAYGHGIIYKLSPSGAFQIIHSFASAETITRTVFDFQPLVAGSDGFLYGLSLSGGANKSGILYRLKGDGSAFAVLRTFQGGADSPFCGLVPSVDGKSIFFLTATGTKNGTGTVSKITPGGGVSTVMTFSDPNGWLRPRITQIVQGKNGRLFGITGTGSAGDYGQIFRVEPGIPLVGVYAFSPPDANKINADGYSPDGLVRGPDGNLYGSTRGGGANGAGTVYMLTLQGSLTTLYNFTSNTGAYQNGANADGANASVLVTGADGNLYGAADYGGEKAFGALYSIAPALSVDILHDFSGPEGVEPISLIEGKDGFLYGVTYSTTTYGIGSGTLFQATRDGKTLRVLHPFGYDRPNSGLIQGTDGGLYGTTLQGQNIYRATTGGSVVIYQCTLEKRDIDGAPPYAGLMQAKDGKFYGTMYGIGANGGGTLFGMTSAGALTVLHAFTTAEGTSPQAPLFQASDGLLYGAASRDGSINNAGSVFVFDLKTNVLKPLHIFDRYKENPYPIAGLVEARNGFLYGTASGIYGASSLFRLKKDDGTGADTLQTLYSFDLSTSTAYTSGAYAPLLAASDGNLYGVKGDGTGMVYKVTPDDKILTLYRFTGPNGTGPMVGPLIESKDGNLYGVTGGGGKYGYGTLFRINRGSLGTPAVPADVTGQVTLNYKGRNQTGSQYNYFYTLTNNGGALSGPIYFMLYNLPSGMNLVNATGTTIQTTPAGSPYVQISSGGLATGAVSPAFTLSFNMPISAGLNRRILAGPGTP